MKKPPAGFTLIELMITVAIIGILAAVVYPSYRKQVMRSGRSEARIALLQIQVAQEKFFMQTTPSRYAGSTTAAASVAELNAASSDSPPGLGVQSITTNKYYKITLITPTSTTYTAMAVPNGSQATDTDCASFTIDQNGTHGSLNSDGARTESICWAK